MKAEENDFSDAITGCSDCQVFALRQIQGEVSQEKSEQLKKLFDENFLKTQQRLPSEHSIAFLLSPLKEKVRNCFGVYSPNHMNKQSLFPLGIRQQKKTHAKKYISSRNLDFLIDRVNLDKRIILENELSLRIIPFFVMIKSYLKIAKAAKIPIRLSIRMFEGNFEALTCTEIKLDYIVTDGKYTYGKITNQHFLTYECVSYRGEMNCQDMIKELCSPCPHYFSGLTKKDSTNQLIEEFSNRISNVGLENLILSDGAAHKQFAGAKGLKENQECFQKAIELLRQVEMPQFSHQQMAQYQKRANQIGCSKINPSLLLIIHVFADRQAP